MIKKCKRKAIKLQKNVIRNNINKCKKSSVIKGGVKIIDKLDKIYEKHSKTKATKNVTNKIHHKPG